MNEKVVLAKLILVLHQKTSPENCYVNDWCVHYEWMELVEWAEYIMGVKK